jgi:hypothetical protein
LDPISIVVAALSAGAVAGLNETATDAVKSAYASLKHYVGTMHPSPAVEQLEQDPKSPNRQGVVAEDLAASGAADDAELLNKAHNLLALIEETDPAAARVVGVDLKRIRGASLHVEDIEASGGNDVRAAVLEDVDVTGDVTVKGARARGGSPKKKD